MSREFLQAISKNEVEIVKEMISSDSNLLQLRNQTGESPILTAVYHGATASRDFLLGQGIQLDLFEAAAVGELQRVRELIDEDRNCVNEYGNDGFTPLGLAAFFGHKEAVEELLARGADPNIASNNSMRV